MVNKTEKKNRKILKFPKSLQKLVRLIEIMTPVQKRIFKKDALSLAAKDRKDFLYLQVFDAVNKFTNNSDNDVNEEKLMKHLLKMLAKDKFENKSKQVNDEDLRHDLSILTKYLYDKLLISMRYYGQTKGTFQDLCSQLQDIYFLYNNNLTEDCYDMLKSAATLAETLDHPAILLEITALENRITHSQNADMLRKDHRLLKQRQRKAKNVLQLYNALLEMNNAVVEFATVKKSIQPKMQAKINSLISQFGNDESSKNLGIRTRFRFFVLGQNYFMYMNQINPNAANLEKRHYFSKAMYELLKSEPSFVEDDYYTYLLKISDYLVSLLRNKDYDTIEAELKELEKSKDELFHIKVLSFIRLMLYNEQNRYDKSLEFLKTKRLYENVTLYKNNIWAGRYISLCFLGAYICVMQHDYKAAKLWSELIVADKRYGTIPNFRIPAYFINALSKFQIAPEDYYDHLEFIKKEARKFNSRFPTTRMKDMIKFANKLTPLFEQFMEEINLFGKVRNDVKKELNEKLYELQNLTRKDPLLEPMRIPVAWIISRINNTAITDEAKD